MALIDVTKESLLSVISNYLASDMATSNQGLAEAILNYYTPVIPGSPPSSGSVAFMVKDIISGELVPIFSPFNSERKCRDMKLKYFPTAQYKVVKLYEVVE